MEGRKPFGFAQDKKREEVGGKSEEGIFSQLSPNPTLALSIGGKHSWHRPYKTSL
ncbi:hypothetical protein [Microcoleus asticus]|uniref:hypothetical protein n=1 Tax=Microcoleus asticus TaxID=2815231 RepID=UPI00155190BA|nr:hypothetical protein [Microcoleus asticus]